MDNQTVTISLDEYNKLIEDSKLLDALFAAGVDNWEGYEEAKNLLEQNCDD